MVSKIRPGARRPRLAPGQVPDPLRAHGAWVYLAVSILAGAFAAPELAPALLAGAASVGAFVAAGSLAAVGRGDAAARLAAGSLLLAGAPALALRLGADPSFLVVALVAVPPALAAAHFARADGFLSPGALGFGVAALAGAAPTAASAGGASPRMALVVLAVLAPFFFWRTWRLAKALGPGWTRERFARQGLLESGLAIAWGAVAVAAARLARPLLE